MNEFTDFTLPVQKLKLSGFQIRSSSAYSAILYVYFIGVSVFLLNFFHSIFKIVREIKLSIPVEQGKIKILRSNRYHIPFSFFNWIFVPQGFEQINGKSIILEHEKVHVKQMHSLDLILMEMFVAAFWFNPVVHFIKRSLKSIHEYSADREVVNNYTSVSEYLALLVEGTEMSCLSGLAHPFKSLTLQKRIIMILKINTPGCRKYFYLLIIPLIAAMIQGFTPVHSGNNPPSLKPVKNSEITSAFGVERKIPFNKDISKHTGIDLKAPLGTDVLAPASGVVIEAVQKKDWGNMILIKHDEQYQTFYAHLNDFIVKAGDQVTRGQIIGHVGNSGYSLGPHLHYEVIKNGKRVNPEDYFGSSEK